MPIYVYKCDNHGETELLQGMNDVHEADCPICNKPMKRIFLTTQLRCERARLGNTRMELFDNLAADGHMSKDWRASDTYYQQAIGATNGI